MLDSAKAQIPRARAARDSLIAAVEGRAPLSEDLFGTVTTAWATLVLPTALTWRELGRSSGSLLISNEDRRRELARYYAFRESAEEFIGRAEQRGRYQFVQAQFDIGILEPPPQELTRERRSWRIRTCNDG